MNHPFPKVIAFDADDTLWINEPLYVQAEETLEKILTNYLDCRELRSALYRTEMKNLSIFGYGIKGFTLSMIETAVELTGGEITGHAIQEIIDISKELLRHPVHLLPGVEETLQALHGRASLWIITKGDLFDQESKVARSGLANYFDRVEILSEKDEITYRKILARHAVAAEDFMMIGNSPRSDILPIRSLGGQAVWIPFRSTWEHEQASDEEMKNCGCHQLGSMHELRSLLEIDS